MLEHTITRPSRWTFVSKCHGSISYGETFLQYFLGRYSDPKQYSRVTLTLPNRKRLPIALVDFRDRNGEWNRVTLRPSPTELETLGTEDSLSAFWGDIADRLQDWSLQVWEANRDTPPQAWGKEAWLGESLFRAFNEAFEFAGKIEDWMDKQGIPR